MKPTNRLPASQRPATPRTAPPAGLRPPGGAAHRAGGGRDLGASLGGLVHACEKGVFDLESIAEQTLEKWRQSPEATLTIHATALLVDGEEALAATAPDGRWILPTFMAGLRQIGMEGTAQVADLIRLAEELGRVRSTVEAVENLRDWIWMDGAEGFEVEVEESFTDLLDAAFVDQDSSRQKLFAVRAEAATALSEDVVAVASADLDAAAVRDEFQVPLDGLVEDARERKFDVDAARRDELRSACEDASFWVRAQLDFVLAHPELQGSLPPPRLAREILVHANRGVDPSFLELVASLLQRPEPYSHALVATLEQAPVGETLAANARLDAGTSAPFRTLFSGDRSRITRGLVHGLLERASADELLAEALAELAASIGLKLFWKHIELAELKGTEMRALARILPRCEVSPAIARDLLRNAKVSAPLLRAVPPTSLVKLGDELKLFLREAPAAQAEPAVDALAAADDLGVLRMLGEILAEREGGGWRKQTLESLMGALVAKGLGKELLVPFARNRSVPWNARLLAFQALAASPEDFAVATRWSLDEWREPAPVRRWLSEARKHGKQKPEGS